MSRILFAAKHLFIFRFRGGLSANEKEGKKMHRIMNIFTGSNNHDCEEGSLCGWNVFFRRNGRKYRLPSSSSSTAHHEARDCHSRIGGNLFKMAQKIQRYECHERSPVSTIGIPRLCVSFPKHLTQ